MPAYRFQTERPTWRWTIARFGDGWLLRGIGPAVEAIEPTMHDTAELAANAVLSGLTGSPTWNNLPFDTPPRSVVPFELSDWTED
jgi:hypothetical protein